MLLSTEARVLGISLPVFLLWKCKATGVVQIGSGSTAWVLPAAGFSDAPLGTKTVEVVPWGFCSVSSLDCKDMLSSWPLQRYCKYCVSCHAIRVAEFII